MHVYMHVFPYILNYHTMYGVSKKKPLLKQGQSKQIVFFVPKRKKEKKFSPVQGLQARRTTD